MNRTRSGFRAHFQPGFRLGVAAVPYFDGFAAHRLNPRTGTDFYIWLGPLILSLHRHKCSFRSNGGMRCAGRQHHDGPHTFTNREWRRTRHASPNSEEAKRG